MRDALLFFYVWQHKLEPIGNYLKKGVSMTLDEFELKNLPETLSLEQIRLILHVSKLTARYYVQSGLLKSKNSGKQTRCYTVTRNDLLLFIEEYKEDPGRCQPPKDWYKTAGQVAVKRKRRLVPKRASEYCKYLFYGKLLKAYPDLLDTNQVAKLTGYNIRTVNRWVTAGELKAIMTKPKNLFPKQYVLDFLISDFYESISVKSALHICHLNKIYQEYTELHTEDENKDEE